MNLNYIHNIICEIMDDHEYRILAIDYLIKNDEENYKLLCLRLNILFKIESYCKKKLLMNYHKEKIYILQDFLFENKKKITILKKYKYRKPNYKKIFILCIKNIQGIQTKKIPFFIRKDLKNKYKTITMNELQIYFNKNFKRRQYFNQIPYFYSLINNHYIILDKEFINIIQEDFLNIIKISNNINYYYFIYKIIQHHKTKHKIIKNIPLPSYNIRKKYDCIFDKFYE